MAKKKTKKTKKKGKKVEAKKAKTYGDPVAILG